MEKIVFYFINLLIYHLYTYYKWLYHIETTSVKWLFLLYRYLNQTCIDYVYKIKCCFTKNFVLLILCYLTDSSNE